MKTHWQEEYEVRWKQWEDEILAETSAPEPSIWPGLLVVFGLSTGFWTLVIWAIVRHWKP